MPRRSDFDSEGAFRVAVEGVLKQLLAQLDELDADIEPRLSEGNLSISFEEGGKASWMLSQQTPTHELWLSANYTAWHFLREGGQWVERDSGEALSAVLSRLLGEELGQPVALGV